MTNFFDNNIRLLESFDPETASLLRQVTPGSHVAVFPVSDGHYSLRVSYSGKEYLLHSAKDPVRESERWISGHPDKDIYNMIVYGCGFFHHIVQLILKYNQNLKTLAIIESDIHIVHAAFCYLDLSSLLTTKSVFFHIGGSDSDLRRFMQKYLVSFVLDEVEIFEHQPSLQSNPEYYHKAKQVVQESLQSGEILIRTKVQLGGMIQENIIRNLPEMLNNPNISALNGILSNIPAFIVGAGPSLDKNIDELKRVGDQGVIIAVDTIFNKLRNYGITPHIVVSTDPTYLNAAHFNKIDDLGETILVFSPSVYHPILSQLKGTKVVIPLMGSRFLSTLSDVFGNMATFKTGVNVGQTSFNLARFMGCDPIVLTGLDFSFPIEGGKTHASGTALQRNIYLSNTPGKMKVELISDTPELEEFEPIYIPGSLTSKVATNKFWFAYLRSMEEEIKASPVKIINSTEGGARIQGAEVARLADTIQKYCLKDCLINSSLQMAVGFFFGMFQEEGKSVLNQAVAILNEAAEQADKGIQLVSELDSLANSYENAQLLLGAKIDEIMQVHENLVQKQMIYAVLDEAADKVLQPFLKQSVRMNGQIPTPDNVKRMVDRYTPYFTGMKELCIQFKKICEETVTHMNDSGFSGFSW